jgi:hypothetical protein
LPTKSPNPLAFIRGFLLSAVLLGGMAVRAGSVHRYETVSGTITNAPYALVKISVEPEDQTPGCASTQYVLADADGAYEAAVPVFMGKNTIHVECAGAEEEITREVNAPPVPFRVKMEWIGHYAQDYDLYVNNIHGGIYMEEDGGYLDRDHSTEVDWWYGWWQIEEIVETIAYPAATGGVYKIGAEYCGELGNESMEPRDIKVEAFVDRPYASTEPNVSQTLFLDSGFLWNIATLRINAAGKTGWYEVDENNRRVMNRSAWEICDGVFPRLADPSKHQSGYRAEMTAEEFASNTTNLVLGGPNGSDAVYLQPGQSAQFSMNADLNLGYDHDTGEHLWDTNRTVYGYFSATNTSGGTAEAYIDDFGVLTVTNTGHYQVCAPGGVPAIDVYCVSLRLAPDYDRDGTIGTNDARLAAAGMPFRFWVNDDNDDPNSEVSGNDLPGQGTQISDYDDWAVDGLRDLIDFFPVKIELDDALCDTDKFEYYLEHVQFGLHFMYSDLGATNVSDYLEDVETARDYADKTVELVASGLSAGGTIYTATKLDDGGFLSRIGDFGEAVLLLEASGTTTEPLVLLIKEKTSGTVVATTELNLSIDSVESMFLHENVRDAAKAETNVADRADSPNLPAHLLDNKGLVFVHGYNCDEDSARSFQAETFKRMWRSGYNGQFLGITWFGHPDEFGSIGPPEYHQAIVNAFASASNVCAVIEGFKTTVGGPVDVIAHSAGNVVVSSAVQDHGCTFRNYIALDAAVPVEAYGSTADIEIDSNGIGHLIGVDSNMVSSAKFDEGILSGAGIQEYSWSEYDARLHSSEWYRLHENTSDERKTLTWRNRFASVGQGNPTGYNFYSSTEEVLRNYEGDGLVHGTFWDWFTWAVDYVPGVDPDQEAGEHFTKLYVWAKQEKTKGRKDDWMIASFGGLPDAYTGWGFSQEGQFINEFLWILDTSPKSPADIQAEINGTNSVAFWETVKTDPLFRKRPEVLFGTNDVSSLMDDDCTTISGLPANDVTTGCRFDDWLLSSAFPARTWAMGANVNSSWKVVDDPSKRNFDMTLLYMNDEDSWPELRKCDFQGTDRKEWHHSDFRDVAYTHVCKMFKKWVELTEE